MSNFGRQIGVQDSAVRKEVEALTRLKTKWRSAETKNEIRYKLNTFRTHSNSTISTGKAQELSVSFEKQDMIYVATVQLETNKE